MGCRMLVVFEVRILRYFLLTGTHQISTTEVHLSVSYNSSVLFFLLQLVVCLSRLKLKISRLVLGVQL